MKLKLEIDIELKIEGDVALDIVKEINRNIVNQCLLSKYNSEDIISIRPTLTLLDQEVENERNN